jgi:hypothetical protein
VESTLYAARLGEESLRFGGRSLCGPHEADANVQIADDFFPAEIAASDGLFVLDVFLAEEKKLGEIGEELGVAPGNAIGSDKLEELADDVIDVGGGGEFAGERGELAADAIQLKELLLFAGVDNAEGGMRFVAEHAALASVGEGKLAERGFFRGDSGAGIF